jgi:hypothetical protein
MFNVRTRLSCQRACGGGSRLPRRARWFNSTKSGKRLFSDRPERRGFRELAAALANIQAGDNEQLGVPWRRTGRHARCLDAVAGRGRRTCCRWRLEVPRSLLSRRRQRYDGGLSRRQGQSLREVPREEVGIRGCPQFGTPKASRTLAYSWQMREALRAQLEICS